MMDALHNLAGKNRDDRRQEQIAGGRDGTLTDFPAWAAWRSVVRFLKYDPHLALPTPIRLPASSSLPPSFIRKVGRNERAVASAIMPQPRP